MKKIISIVGIVIGALIIVSNVAPMIIGAILKKQISDSVGIIGGVDGPTAVMVVGTLGTDLVVIELAVGILLIAVGIWGYRRYRK